VGKVLDTLKEYAAVIGLVGVLLTMTGLWATYTYGIERRSISCDITNVTALLSSKAKEETNLEVTFLGKKVPNIHLAELAFCNTGNRNILPTEYIEPITVAVGARTEILSADIADSNPRDLMGEHRPLINEDRTHVSVPAVLLNQGDGFKLKLLTSQQPNLSVASRIVGIGEITRTNYEGMFAIGLFFLACAFVDSFYVSYLGAKLLNTVATDLQKLREQITKALGKSEMPKESVSPTDTLKVAHQMGVLLPALFLILVLAVGAYCLTTALEKLDQSGVQTFRVGPLLFDRNKFH
jgi:hypothetical protein